MLTGESGTGKELFAQAIHSASERGDRAFIAINCGSLPRSLIESELFGYERGAFTGAKREGQAGKFELANGGTLFLDEIGDMPADVQVSLLRVLQNKEIVRIGGSHPIKIDVRVIAATNKDLLKAIENNTFRSDLYYRLNVLSIHIPALRERGGDVRVLANYFLKKYGSDSAKPVQGFTDEAYQLLEHYTWPGNIRELENAMERATIVGQEEFITAADLPEAVRSSSPEVERQRGANHLDTDGSLSGAEQSIILRALEEKNGNVTEAALLLGVSRRTLYRKLQKYGIKSRQVRFS